MFNAAFFDMQHDMSRLEHNEYVSAQLSAEQDNTIHRLKQELRLAEITITAMRERQLAVEKPNELFEAERDDMRSFGIHAYDVVRRRFLAIERLSNNLGLNMDSDNFEMVEVPTVDEQTAAIQVVATRLDNGELVDHRSWSMPSTIVTQMNVIML
jgi:hypothetical protein